jgi:amino-acid N-acetyltransferase
VNLHSQAHERASTSAAKHVGFAVADPVELRPARNADVEAVYRLIEAHLEEGHLLPRTRNDIAAEVDQFVVATREDVVVGCAELARLGPDVAEVRSLVVSDEVQGQGVGRALVSALMAMARDGPYTRLCAFTHAPAFFVRLGFSIVPHLDVPEKVFTECVRCPLFGACGQHAVVYWLRGVDRREKSLGRAW